MKKLLAVFVAVAFVLSVAGLAIAQETKAAAPAAEKAAPMKAEKKAKAEKAKQVTGTVEAVSADSITVKPAKGDAVTAKGSDKVKFDAFKQGDKVTLKYKGDAAVSVKAAKAGKKAAKAEMKKEEPKKEAAPAPAAPAKK